MLTKSEKMAQVQHNRIGEIVGTMLRELGIFPGPDYQIPERFYKVAKALADTYLPINNAVYLEVKEFAKTLPKGKNKNNLNYIVAKIEGLK